MLTIPWGISAVLSNFICRCARKISIFCHNSSQWILFLKFVGMLKFVKIRNLFIYFFKFVFSNYAACHMHGGDFTRYTENPKGVKCLANSSRNKLIRPACRPRALAWTAVTASFCLLSVLQHSDEFQRFYTSRSVQPTALHRWRQRVTHLRAVTANQWHSENMFIRTTLASNWFRPTAFLQLPPQQKHHEPPIIQWPLELIHQLKVQQL